MRNGSVGSIHRPENSASDRSSSPFVSHFARRTARAAGRPTDITALAESIALDFADTVRPIGFVSDPAVTTICRVGAIRRALRNLIENAVAHGEPANVSIEADAKTVRIVVEDDGPSIDTAEIDRVFAPFVGLETSRSRETEALASVCPSLVRSRVHIVPENSNEGGLRAILSLPPVES